MKKLLILVLAIVGVTAVFAQTSKNDPLVTKLVNNMQKTNGQDSSVVAKGSTPKTTQDWADTSGNKITNVGINQAFNPFNDLHFGATISTTMGYDLSENNFGFSYYFSPTFKYSYGPRKNLEYTTPDTNGFHTSIEIKDFRIQSYDNTFNNSYSNAPFPTVIPYNADATNTLPAIVPVFTMGDVNFNIGGYGFNAQFSIQPEIRLNANMPVGAEIDVYSPLLKYGQILSANSIQQYLALNHNSATAQEAIENYYGLKKSAPTDGTVSDSITDFESNLSGNLQTDNGMVFLTDGVEQAVRNYLTQGPGADLSYTWNKTIATHLAIASYGNLPFGMDMPKDNRNMVGMLISAEMLSTNPYVPGLDLAVATDMLLGGKTGLGAANKVNNKPIGFGIDASYQYNFKPNSYFIKPVAGAEFAFNTAKNNDNRRMGYTSYAGIVLGMPMGKYDNGTAYYETEYQDGQDLPLGNNPVFGERDYKGGLTAVFNYVKEPFKGRDPYYNVSVSFVHPHTSILVPGLDAIIAYNVGQLGLKSVRNALEAFLGYYVTKNIEVYAGTNIVFAGKEAYKTLTFPNSSYTTVGMNDSAASYYTIYSKNAQAYVKAGVLFDHVLPYTSFAIQYNSNELVNGYVNTVTNDKEKAGAITATVKADF